MECRGHELLVGEITNLVQWNEHLALSYVWIRGQTHRDLMSHVGMVFKLFRWNVTWNIDCNLCNLEQRASGAFIPSNVLTFLSFTRQFFLFFLLSFCRFMYPYPLYHLPLHGRVVNARKRPLRFRGLNFNHNFRWRMIKDLTSLISMLNDKTVHMFTYINTSIRHANF